MSDKMTPVYSGGLMYEYTFEENAYGIINITRPVPENIKNQTGERIELPEYTSLSRAMEKYPAPTGDGGYVSTSTSVACPTKEAKWLVDSTLLPAIPEKAKVVSVPDERKHENVCANLASQPTSLCRRAPERAPVSMGPARRMPEGPRPETPSPARDLSLPALALALPTRPPRA